MILAHTLMRTEAILIQPSSDPLKSKESVTTENQQLLFGYYQQSMM